MLIWHIGVFYLWFYARKSYKRRRHSKVDLLVITILDQLLLRLKILFTHFTKQATLMSRSIVLSLPFLFFFLCSRILTYMGRVSNLHYCNRFNRLPFTLFIMLLNYYYCISKEFLFRINQIYYWWLFCTTHKHYNYLQLL